MITIEKKADTAQDTELGEEQDYDLREASGSHQRMVAMMVETMDLRVGPDPLLEKADRDTLAELESILYSL